MRLFARNLAGKGSHKGMWQDQAAPDIDDVRVLVLMVTGNDMEAVPQIVQLLNVYECRPTLFTAEEIAPVVVEMFFAGLLKAYIDTQTDHGRRNMPLTVEHLRAQFGADAEVVLLQRLQTPENLEWSTWPIVGSIWFEPTEEGERVREERGRKQAGTVAKLKDDNSEIGGCA